MNYFDNGDRFAEPGQLFPTEAVASGFTLAVRRFGGRTAISREVLETAELHTEVDQVLDSLLVGIDVRVLSHRLLSRSQTQTVEVPANPWQHLKGRFAPAWFIRRYPVRMAGITITFHVDVDAAFPQSMIPLSETRFGPAAFHEDAYFETETYGEPYMTYRPQPMTYREIRNYYAEKAEREARILKQQPRGW